VLFVPSNRRTADRLAPRQDTASGRSQIDELTQITKLVYINGIHHSERIMTATAKLFMHGRSQAVRLPKEFRFEGSEVRVSKVGDKVILEPIRKQPIDFDKFWAELDALGARDFLPDGIPDEPPAEPDPRVFFDE
jgi:antitoxin VapB